ncbi:putative RNA methyltransferase-domain-containing protein [Zopfochytrium polystomum]|nr:putative RNA methyltransferase-domain-containing protein [Zopfochytrium polystomum]
MKEKRKGTDEGGYATSALPHKHQHQQPSDRRKLKKLKPSDRIAAGLYQRERELHGHHHQPVLSADSNVNEIRAPRPYTVSVAISATCIAHLEKAELRSYCAGQIGRALALMEVDEVIIYTDAPRTEGVTPSTTTGTFESAAKKNADPQLFLARMLQYLETPGYLRKSLFPVHRDLHFAGVMNPLDAPHHMKIDDQTAFREGVTLSENVERGTLVDCGMRKPVIVEKVIKPGVRVTVKLDGEQWTSPSPNYIAGTIVSPNAPRQEAGLYWGFRVRLAASLAKVMQDSPFRSGYDVTICVSEKAKCRIGTLFDCASDSKSPNDVLSSLGAFEHALVVLGGMKGIEYTVECDESLPAGDCVDVFDHYVKPSIHLGSRVVRPEENLLISLTSLGPLLHERQRKF